MVSILHNKEALMVVAGASGQPMNAKFLASVFNRIGILLKGLVLMHKDLKNSNLY
ncbi:MAG: hypothetical protein HRU20_27200 [Pseudomonadales bacterium]|nr:hypothetical protein [Pseudomonadales bacterium]